MSVLGLLPEALSLLIVSILNQVFLLFLFGFMLSGLASYQQWAETGDAKMFHGGTKCNALFHAETQMPTNKHRIAINLDDEEFSELDAMADRHDVSLSWIGRQAVLEFLSRYKDQQLPLPLRIESRSAERL